MAYYCFRYYLDCNSSNAKHFIEKLSRVTHLLAPQDRNLMVRILRIALDNDRRHRLEVEAIKKSGKCYNSHAPLRGLHVEWQQLLDSLEAVSNTEQWP